MEIILLERIERLGQIGDIVKVRAGFARNYLLPQNKALPSNKANRAYFESQKITIKAENLKKLDEAKAITDKLEGKELTLLRSAGQNGQLYGSASARDITEIIEEQLGVAISRTQVLLEKPMKLLGVFEQKIRLHAELTVSVFLNIAISTEQAKIQKKEFDKERNSKQLLKK